MSAKNRKRPSDPDGKYYTPRVLARQIVDQVLPALGVNRPRKILEPSVGEGVFLEPLRHAFPLANIVGLDMDKPSLRRAMVLDIANCHVKDFLDARYLEIHDVIIGNPPYPLALDFCIKATVLAPTVVFLLRLGFLASRKRFSFWAATPPSRVFVVPARPSFTRDGRTDQTDYCVVCWQAGVRRTELEWLALPVAR